MARFTMVMKKRAIKKALATIKLQVLFFMWAHLGLNQGPPDYESGALTS